MPINLRKAQLGTTYKTFQFYNYEAAFCGCLFKSQESEQYLQRKFEISLWHQSSIWKIPVNPFSFNLLIKCRKEGRIYCYCTDREGAECWANLWKNKVKVNCTSIWHQTNYCCNFNSYFRKINNVIPSRPKRHNSAELPSRKRSLCHSSMNDVTLWRIHK